MIAQLCLFGGMPRNTDLSAKYMTSLEGHLRAGFFQALCDPMRLALVARLAACGRPLTVTEVSQCSGIHFSGVSRHLVLLKRAGLVRAEKQGREMHYTLEVASVVSTLRDVATALEACSSQAKGAAV